MHNTPDYRWLLLTIPRGLGALHICRMIVLFGDKIQVKSGLNKASEIRDRRPEIIARGRPLLTYLMCGEVKNHPYAGKYIEVQHSGRYVTRYLHLSRILVKQGQKVTRGERIASSGNTGRSTGPHLHFELRIKGQAVNPIKAKIPLMASIPKSKRQEFNEQVTALISLMEKPLQQIARSGSSTETTL